MQQTLKDNKLKMYVWHGVLTDYTSGMIVAFASNIKEARKVVLRDWLEEYEGDKERIISEISGKPEVFSRPGSSWVYGGG